MPHVLTTIAEAKAVLREVGKTDTIALVPTMGALHEGHLSLVDIAKRSATKTVVSVFVNPMQFAPGEDFERYPRTFEDDLAKLDAAGVDYVFAPAVSDMYPNGIKQTRVAGGPAAGILEAAHRLAHFDGVLTVVTKLFNIIRPNVAVFGEKDAQQLFLVRSLVRDLDLDIDVVGAPIIREEDGLARSSRNVYLSDDERSAALSLVRALSAAAANGDRGIREMISQAQGALMDEKLVKMDYVSIVDPETFVLVNEAYRGTALVLVAARVGTTRLIDNMPAYVGEYR